MSIIRTLAKSLILGLSLLLSMTISSELWAQGQTCTLLITDMEGRAIPIAEVILSKKEHFFADSQGYCTLPIRQNVKLKIRSLGYKTFIKKNFSPQANKTYPIRLEEDVYELESLVVRRQKKASQLTQNAAVMDMEQLKKISTVPLAKVLETIPGLSSIGSGATIAKPVIQGMHSSRILLINSGVRLESQAWGSDHAPEIDHTGANIIEVIKGAESIRYGAGALGGVVLFNPAPLPFGYKKLYYDGQVSGSYASNGQGKSTSAHLSLGYKNYALRIQGSMKYFGDYSTPNYLINNTGQREGNYALYLGAKFGKLRLTGYLSRFKNEAGIFFGSHVGGLADLLARFEYGRPYEASIYPYSDEIKAPKQVSEHWLVKTEADWQINKQNQLNLRLSYQHNHRQEYENRKSERYNKIPVMNLHLRSYIADLMYQHKWNLMHSKTTLGCNIQRLVNVNTHGTAATPFIPNYTSHISGLYVIHKLAPLEKLILEGGMRYDYRITDAAGFNWRKEPYGGLKRYANLTGSFAAFWQCTEGLRLRLNYGLAWRAPDVNELYSNGKHHGGSWSLGNDKLDSERGYKLVLGSNYKGNLFAIDASIFYQNIKNYIYDSPNKQYGRNGIHIHWNGVYPIFAFQQDDARFYGGDVFLKSAKYYDLSFSAKGEWIRGRNISQARWLPFIPSDRYTLSAEWNKSFGKQEQWQSSLELENIFVCKQKNFDPEKDFVTETPSAYKLLNLKASLSYRLTSGEELDLILTIDNLLNKEYKEYTDRFRYYAHSMGRNISLKLNVLF